MRRTFADFDHGADLCGFWLNWVGRMSKGRLVFQNTHTHGHRHTHREPHENLIFFGTWEKSLWTKIRRSGLSTRDFFQTFEDEAIAESAYARLD